MGSKAVQRVTPLRLSSYFWVDVLYIVFEVRHRAYTGQWEYDQEAAEYRDLAVHIYQHMTREELD